MVRTSLLPLCFRPWLQMWYSLFKSGAHDPDLYRKLKMIRINMSSCSHHKDPLSSSDLGPIFGSKGNKSKGSKVNNKSKGSKATNKSKGSKAANVFE